MFTASVGSVSRDYGPPPSQQSNGIAHRTTNDEEHIFLVKCRYEYAPVDLLMKTNSGGKHMKYMLLIDLAEQAMSATEREQCCVESVQLAHELHASGQYLAAAPLHPVATATGVRGRDANGS
jgi:hypothetical protein